MGSSKPAHQLSRRRLLGAALGSGAAMALPAAAGAEPQRYAARPPGGMVRLSMPGRVVRVTAANTLQPNELWPKPEAAKTMLLRAMTELTGKSDLGEAFAQFVHPDDTVAIKPNGLGAGPGATMASNMELIVEIARGVVAAGVPPSKITIFEQFVTFLKGTRVIDGKLQPIPELPKGVQTVVHRNKGAVMDAITVSGIPTKFVKTFTDATAVINVPVIKDHSLCGYTGALKNITHGCNTNPQSFHAHHCSPQIAELYAQDVVRSRVVLHVVDGYKALYDGGPKDRKPGCRVAHEAVYVSTDPVALDVLGWEVIDKLRRDNGLATLQASGREPTYIRVAADLGLGVSDRKHIDVTAIRT